MRKVFFLTVSINVLHNTYSLTADLATVVGYLVVSRPFLDLSDPRHQNSTHAELLEVNRPELKQPLDFKFC